MDRNLTATPRLAARKAFVHAPLFSVDHDLQSQLVHA